MKKILFILSLTCVFIFTRCGKKSELDLTTNKYTTVANEIAAWDDYDYEHLGGKKKQAQADSLYKRIEELNKNEVPTINQLKQIAAAATTLSNASYKRLKEFDKERSTK